MRTRKSKPTPSWKEIILGGPDWPKKLSIPQHDPMPKGTESILESTYCSEHWEWELWRQPDGQRYFLKVWPFNHGDFGNPNTPGLALTVPDTFQFLLTNWMPQDIFADLAAQCPTPLKDLVNLENPSSLN